MATVGPKLTIPFVVGPGAIVGQGSLPELWAVYTTDDASVVSPAWVDASTKVRAGETNRGPAVGARRVRHRHRQPHTRQQDTHL